MNQLLGTIVLSRGQVDRYQLGLHVRTPAADFLAKLPNFVRIFSRKSELLGVFFVMLDVL